MEKIDKGHFICNNHLVQRTIWKKDTSSPRCLFASVSLGVSTSCNHQQEFHGTSMTHVIFPLMAKLWRWLLKQLESPFSRDFLRFVLAQVARREKCWSIQLFRYDSGSGEFPAAYGMRTWRSRWILVQQLCKNELMQKEKYWTPYWSETRGASDRKIKT